MSTLWRISNHPDLSGEGGLRFSARWHTKGRRIVYLATSPPGALIEVLVHLEIRSNKLPPGYTLIKVSVPDDLLIEDLHPPDGPDWKEDLVATRKVGDAWLLRNSAALARVPSSIMPSVSNILMNPSHDSAKLIQVIEVTQAIFDSRLFT